MAGPLAPARAVRALLAAALLLAPGVCLADADGSRTSVIARAHIRVPRDVAALNMKRGPAFPGAFAPGELVQCDYVEGKLNGRSKKFACRAGQDELKVKFGDSNGDVFGEVAATRLLWGLGFGADGMYPVRLVCRGCPESFGVPAGPGARLIDPAAIERKMPGRELEFTLTEGWSWQELDLVDERAGGASPAERDALRLVAVLMQHTDTKLEQQRLLCLDESPHGPLAESGAGAPADCARPFMLVNDLGLTFGRANLGNVNALGSVNFHEWSRMPVWKGPRGCVGNLPKSLTGTLKDPVISESGRHLLAGLLEQLSDRQLHDLFEVAQFDRRNPLPQSPSSHPAAIADWVQAFKQKRQEIADRHCVESWSTVAPPTFSTGPNLWLQSRATSRATAAMKTISLIGYTSIYMAIAVALTFGYRMRAGAALMLLLALNVVIVDATKLAVSSPRPDQVDDGVRQLGSFHLETLVRGIPESRTDDADPYGFPSGHIAAATVFFLGLRFFFGWRWAWTALALWLPVMAVSRLYLGRHFLGDVLGGFGAGIIITALALEALNLGRFSADNTDARAARRIVKRTVTVAASLAACSVILHVPDAYDAGRLLGIALGVAALIFQDRAADDAPVSLRIGRVALTALVFTAVWWGAAMTVDPLTVLDRPARALIAGALPGVALLSGAFYSGSVKLKAESRKLKAES
jgi:membrane-associated phospholipid phosphatase